MTDPFYRYSNLLVKIYGKDVTSIIIEYAIPKKLHNLTTKTKTTNKQTSLIYKHGLIGYIECVNPKSPDAKMACVSNGKAFFRESVNYCNRTICSKICYAALHLGDKETFDKWYNPYVSFSPEDLFKTYNFEFYKQIWINYIVPKSNDLHRTLFYRCNREQYHDFILPYIKPDIDDDNYDCVSGWYEHNLYEAMGEKNCMESVKFIIGKMKDNNYDFDRYNMFIYGLWEHGGDWEKQQDGTIHSLYNDALMYYFLDKKEFPMIEIDWVDYFRCITTFAYLFPIFPNLNKLVYEVLIEEYADRIIEEMADIDSPIKIEHDVHIIKIKETIDKLDNPDTIEKLYEIFQL